MSAIGKTMKAVVGGIRDMLTTPPVDLAGLRAKRDVLLVELPVKRQLLADALRESERADDDALDQPGSRLPDISAVYELQREVAARERRLQALDQAIAAAEAAATAAEIALRKAGLTAMQTRRVHALGLVGALKVVQRALDLGISDAVGCAQAALALAQAGGPVYDEFAAGLVGGPELDAEIARLVPLVERAVLALAPEYTAERDHAATARQAVEHAAAAQQATEDANRASRRKAYVAYLAAVVGRREIQSDDEYIACRTAIAILDDCEAAPQRLHDLLRTYYDLRIQSGGLRTWSTDGQLLNKLAGVTKAPASVA